MADGWAGAKGVERWEGKNCERGVHYWLFAARGTTAAAGPLLPQTVRWLPSYGSRKRGEVLTGADALAASVELDGGVLGHGLYSRFPFLRGLWDPFRWRSPLSGVIVRNL